MNTFTKVRGAGERRGIRVRVHQVWVVDGGGGVVLRCGAFFLFFSAYGSVSLVDLPNCIFPAVAAESDVLAPCPRITLLHRAV